MVHGVAKLAVGGQLPLSSTAQVLQFTDLAAAAIGQGMVNIADPRLHARRSEV